MSDKLAAGLILGAFVLVSLVLALLDILDVI